MAKLIVSLSILFSFAFACEQNHVSTKASSMRNEQLSYDTTMIAILPVDTANPWLFKDAISIEVTNQDLQTIERLLTECIKVHNINKDSSQEFTEYIDIKKYKRQYVPFQNSKGERKVYVNCFCISDWRFDYWKETLVQVEDGGSCFFQALINLKALKYEQFSTNGY